MTRFCKLFALVVGLGCLILTAPATGQGWQNNFPPNLVTMVCAERNNVFYRGQPISFALQGNAAVTYQVRDYWGSVVDQGPVSGSTLTVNVKTLGWYKVYLFGSTSQAPWGTVVGGTMFIIVRDNPHFPVEPAPSLSGSLASPLNDEILRGFAAIGPQRHAALLNPVSTDITYITGEVGLDQTYYTNPRYADPVRPRDMFIAFPNGTSPSSSVSQVVQAFHNTVKYYEPRNEPQNTPAATFVANEMAPFYQTVKSVDPTCMVIGPDPVSIIPGTMPWVDSFFADGGGNYIDGFSFHAYNMLSGDLAVARESMDAMMAELAKWGQQNKPIWQTEQGNMACIYGAFEPRHQARWDMLQMMVFEQYGIPKEHSNLWYDKDGGFWDIPSWTENPDHSLNPSAAMIRVWSEELYGTKFVQRYDFGNPGDKLYIGSLFGGPGKSVAAFMSAGQTDGSLTLDVTGGNVLHVVSAFGVESDIRVADGQAVLPVPEVPVYVELQPLQSISVVPVDWGPDLALTPGTIASSSGTPTNPVTATIPDSPSLVINGLLENNNYNGVYNWMSNVNQFPAWIEVDLPAPTTISKAVIYCPIPWSWQGSLLDYDLQYYSNGEWLTIQHVTEPTNTFPVYSPSERCTCDSFYSDRCIFIHQFTPVTTSKVRVLVNSCTWGGGATQDVVNAGGMTGPHQFDIREIELYSPYYNQQNTETICGLVRTSSGAGVPGVAISLSGYQSASCVTDPRGNYSFSGLPTGASYTVAPAAADYSLAPKSRTYSALTGSNACDFTATSLAPGSGTGLFGSYYNLPDALQDVCDPAQMLDTEIDPDINYPGWDSVLPDGITNSFCVSWTGWVEPRYTEPYTFTADMCDGSQVYVNGQLLVNNWTWPQAKTSTSSGTISLVAGQRIPIVVDYFHSGGAAWAELSWESPSQPQQIVPQAYLYPSFYDMTPSVGLASPVVGDSVVTGQPTQVVAGASSAYATITGVQFFVNGISIGSSATSPYTVNWTPASNGTYSLAAVATDSEGAQTVSSLVTVTAAPQPAPGIRQIFPTSAAAGSGAFTLTVTGFGFTPSTVVTWNGTALATTFISATQLTASVPASDVASPGQAKLGISPSSLPGPGPGDVFLVRPG